jgi:hypothetical protein
VQARLSIEGAEVGLPAGKMPQIANGKMMVSKRI